jgi:hypothetical protein
MFRARGLHWHDAEAGRLVCCTGRATRSLTPARSLWSAIRSAFAHLGLGKAWSYTLLEQPGITLENDKLARYHRTGHLPLAISECYPLNGQETH